MSAPLGDWSCHYSAAVRLSITPRPPSCAVGVDATTTKILAFKSSTSSASRRNSIQDILDLYRHGFTQATCNLQNNNLSNDRTSRSPSSPSAGHDNVDFSTPPSDGQRSRSDAHVPLGLRDRTTSSRTSTLTVSPTVSLAVAPRRRQRLEVWVRVRCRSVVDRTTEAEDTPGQEFVLGHRVIDDATDIRSVPLLLHLGDGEPAAALNTQAAE
ncbi:hypothetical protein C8Q74DRAFT_1371252 [Fomes fomentarius]|nr:hypothetical protein C8Q74DRAFT_1371252 [Fomes fomentarius]